MAGKRGRERFPRLRPQPRPAEPQRAGLPTPSPLLLRPSASARPGPPSCTPTPCPPPCPLSVLPRTALPEERGQPQRGRGPEVSALGDGGPVSDLESGCAGRRWGERVHTCVQEEGGTDAGTDPRRARQLGPVPSEDPCPSPRPGDLGRRGAALSLPGGGVFGGPGVWAARELPENQAPVPPEPGTGAGLRETVIGSFCSEVPQAFSPGAASPHSLLI